MNLEQPHIVPITDKIYRLESDYFYQYQIGGFEYKIVINKGFQHDGASVPRIVWTLTGILPDGLIRAAALVHDFIYQYEGLLPKGSHLYFDEGVWRPLSGKWKRKHADRIFARIMRESGVSKLKRRLAYFYVRAFGWVVWN